MRLKLESPLEESLSNYLTGAVIIAAILTAPLTIAYWLEAEHSLTTVADWLIWAVFVVEYAFYMAISHDRWKTTKDNWQAEVAALWAVATLFVVIILFGYKGRRPGVRVLVRSLVEAGSSAVDIILICAGAGLVIGVLNMTSMAFDMGMEILRFSQDGLFVLLGMAAAASVILGMGMPTWAFMSCSRRWSRRQWSRPGSRPWLRICSCSTSECCRWLRRR